MRNALVVSSVLVLAACSQGDDSIQTRVPDAPSVAVAGTVPTNLDKNVYFGAVHVHTALSFDAFTNGTRTTPEDAYRWARGETITSSGIGAPLKIQTPLDFYMVSDHAEMLGVFTQMADPKSPLARLPIAKDVLSPDANTRVQAFAQLLRDMSAGAAPPEFSDPAIGRTSWKDIVAAANKYYEPGRFTTFVGFEWTSNPDKRNLHRVVVFRDTLVLPDLPLTSDAVKDDPEGLWAWMEAQRARGSALLAIPHNGNASDGRMFELTKFDGRPIDAAWTSARARNEPLYEITQIKGTSETWPGLSPNDEFAGFELWDYTLSADYERPKKRAGSYARQALLEGLRLQAAGSVNPFKFGFIGDDDTHNAAGANEEFNYTGKFAFENDPKHRLLGVPGMPEGQLQQIREFSSGGLAGVWAEANTREAIFDAMQRKETFATSGPMIRVRLFAGFGLSRADLDAADFVKRGYKGGVPMGGELVRASGAAAPTLLVTAMKDPKSGNLDRIQIVKGWLDASGKPQERIFDVAWSGDRKPDASGKLPPVGSTVDVKTARYRNTIGAPELKVAWTDPQFDPSQRAFYYARVIEIPTPRWSTYDAAKLGVDIPKGLPATLQERAWTSPVWYAPK